MARAWALVGLEPSVATYIDDRYESSPQATLFDLADVERIEVLKGPQGTLYGRNATGGALRVITKGVADEFEANITAGVGNYNARELSGTMSVPVSDTLGIRLTAYTNMRDGFADNLDSRGVSELDDRDFQAFRGKLRWDITDMLTANWSVSYWQQDDNAGNDVIDLSAPGGTNLGTVAARLLGTPEDRITGRDVDEVATAVDKTLDMDQLSTQLRFDWSLESVDIASITTYADFSGDNWTDVEGTSSRALDLVASLVDVETFTQEIQFLSNSDGDLTWLGGFYYMRQDGELLFSGDISDLQTLGLAGIPGFNQGVQELETEAWAVFGQLTYHFNDAWALTVGGRWNQEEKDITLSPISLPGAPISLDADNLLLFTPFEDEEDWNEFTPKATLEYNSGAGLYYLSYARGFKSGGYNYPSKGNPVLEPEILDMLEFGAKLDFESGVRLNAALFYYDYSDLQVTRAAQGGAGGGVALSTENAADAEIFGLEADVTWVPTDELTVTAGMTLLDTEYKDFDASAKVFNPVTGVGMVDVFFDASGESMLRAPDVAGFVTVQYDFRVGDSTLPAVLTYSYTGEYDYDFVASPETKILTQDSYSVVNARLSYVPPSERWEVSIWGRNLTDEEYFNDVVGGGRGLRGSYADPRTYGIEVSVDFY